LNVLVIPTGAAAQLLLLAVLARGQLGVGGDVERAEPDPQRLHERHHPPDHGQAQRAVALEPRDQREGLHLDVARGLADRHRPGGDAAHHHALEHRLAANRRVALGHQGPVG
jgi:hypothetical protein